ncbi:MAG TPA: tRNA (guanosine(37)-N1)-methyltransferase TrmD [Oculatellaceae cyanobacterium]|jgi:tRNA (guanine37-N1)-methyltransferase
MRFSILTLFPDVIEAYASASIIGRARKNGVISVDVVNFRDFSTDPHRKVDDSPFGGGSGMVLSCQPVDSAMESLRPLTQPSRVLMTSPAGRRFDHAYAVELSQCAQIVILCGHYEGFDERIKTLIPEIEEVSIGDFVLTGGELPALCILDAVTRLLPGAVQKFSSVEADSFYSGLLDYPHYTRPAEYKGLKVPDVLLSGNHAAIAKWRHEASLRKTRELRPDLLEP